MKKINIDNYTKTTLSITLGFFFISSIIYINFSTTLSSLRFVSDDVHEILDPLPSTSSNERIFYQSNHVTVFDVNTINIDNILQVIETEQIISGPNSFEITFSDREIKQKFFRMISALDENDLEKENIKKLLVTKSSSTISSGRLCFLENCIDQYIALKNMQHSVDMKKEI
jgi:hypothetical protein